jgi:hypothetical protein
MVAASIVLVLPGYLGGGAAAHWWPFDAASSNAAGSHSGRSNFTKSV